MAKLKSEEMADLALLEISEEDLRMPKKKKEDTS